MNTKEIKQAKQQVIDSLTKSPMTRTELLELTGLSNGTLQRFLETLVANNVIAEDRVHRPHVFRFIQGADLQLIDEHKLRLVKIPEEQYDLGAFLRRYRRAYESDPLNFENEIKRLDNFIMMLIPLAVLDDSVSMAVKLSWDLDKLKWVQKQTQVFFRVNRIATALAEMSPGQRTFASFDVELTENDKDWLQIVRRTVDEYFRT